MPVLLNNLKVVRIRDFLLKCSQTNNALKNVRNFCVAVRNNENKDEAPVPEEVRKSGEKEHHRRHQAEAESKDQRSLHIAVIGVPNAGKSTFINGLISQRVCPTSSKVHTTRKANKAICTTGRTQLVFYDTPGLVTQREIKKHNLGQTFKGAYRHAVQHADLIAVIQDVSNAWTRNELHPTVLDTLRAYPALPSCLILNKIDALKSKRVLLDLIRTLTNNMLSGRERRRSAQPQRQRLSQAAMAVQAAAKQQLEGVELHNREVGWSHFSDVFLVSALTRSGLADLHDYLVGAAKQRAWEYSRETFTDESPESLIVESVRARLLDYLPQEIPYNLHCEIEYYNLENDTIYASVQVNCQTARIERLICGESNGRLRQITERVTSDLVETFAKPVSLTIATRSRHEKV